MPFSNTGVFTPQITFTDGSLATAEDQNSQDVDIAGGLSACMTRAGLAPASANLPMGGFKLTNLGAGSANGDSANVGQLSTTVVSQLGYTPVNPASLGALATVTPGTGVTTAVANPVNAAGGLALFAAKQAPQVTVLTSGTAQTYTTPAGALYLTVEMVGGGSGGSGGGSTAGGAVSAGGNTTFGSLTASGGPGAPANDSATVPTPATATGGDINITGGLGSPSYEINTTYIHGNGSNRGASSKFGEGGTAASAIIGPSVISQSNATGYGAGGGGGGWASAAFVNSGWGGNSGAYLFKQINTPAATYTYTVGAGSAGGSPGTGGAGGGAGSGGLIKVTAYFQ